MESPDTPVALGRVTAPFRTRGWIRVRPYTRSAADILRYRRWHIGGGAPFAVAACRVHRAGEVVASLATVNDRTAAAALAGLDVTVPRAQLPPLAEGEHYWRQLHGLRVLRASESGGRGSENGDADPGNDGGGVENGGADLGSVAGLMETGANDVLVVRADDGGEQLIPWTAQVVREVNLARGFIRVDWDGEYF